MCSENFQGMSPKKKKKIENKQSDIKLTWSNHKKMSFAVTMSPYHSELLFKVSTAI